MKKIAKGLLIAALCLIPTLFSLFAYLGTRETPLEIESVRQMVLQSPDGTLYELNADQKDDKHTIDYWLKLNQRAKKVTSLPKEIDQSTAYVATYHSKLGVLTYRYYFSTTSPSKSYLVDPDKKVYQLNAADSIEFLDSKYSAALYPYSAPPTLTIAGTAVEPTAMDWSYYTYSGTEHPTANHNAVGDVPLLTASYVGLQIQSNPVPDNSFLKIVDENDSILFQGKLKDFHPTTTLKKKITKDTLLHVSLHTDWAYSEGCHYSGQADYRFDVQAIFDPAARFWLGSQSVELGEMVVLSGEFVEELEDLTFTSSPDLGITPTFIRDGDYVRALIAIPRDLSTGAGEYTLTVNCLSKSFPLTLYVTPPTHSTKTRTYNYSGLVQVGVRTEANLTAFRNLITSLPVTTKLLYNDPFFFNTGEGIRANYGETIHNTDSKSDDFMSNGSAIIAYYTTPIYGANTGIVTAVTTTAYGGNTVVIDHGWGLFSVYYCLGKVSVSEGQAVSKDTIIGYGGKQPSNVPQGYTDCNTCYWELWVGGQPISYLPLLEGTPTIGTPND